LRPDAAPLQQVVPLPERHSSTFKTQVQYYNNGIIMPSIPLEWGLTPTGKTRVNAPAKVNQVYPDNALFWDTPCWDAGSEDAPQLFWTQDHTISAYAPFVTMIDDMAPAISSENALLCHPEYPQRRYRNAASRWVGDPLRDSSFPIAWASDAWITSIGPGYNSQNADFGGGVVWNGGNARFRHNGLGCNVAFVDGHVETAYLNPRKVMKGSGAQTYLWNDFKRSWLQIKFQQGMQDSGSDGAEN